MKNFALTLTVLFLCAAMTGCTGNSESEAETSASERTVTSFTDVPDKLKGVSTGKPKASSGGT